MPQKKPFITLAQAKEIAADIPTPFHLYDEKGIRENARRVNAAFSWNKGFKEYFAVKATPNPYLLKILQEEGCGVDCSSYTELLMSEACGFKGSDIMFSSNDTPAQDMKKAYDLGAYINLDDLTHVAFLEKVAGVPKTVCCRFNPGGFPLPQTLPECVRAGQRYHGQPRRRQVRYERGSDGRGLHQADGCRCRAVRHPLLPGQQHRD
mgnify:CR=1 FL=1